MTRPHIFTRHIARALSSGRESSCAPLCKLPEIAAASQDLAGGRGVVRGGGWEQVKGERKEKGKWKKSRRQSISSKRKVEKKWLLNPFLFIRLWFVFGLWLNRLRCHAWMQSDANFGSGDGQKNKMKKKKALQCLSYMERLRIKGRLINKAIFSLTGQRCLQTHRKEPTLNQSTAEWRLINRLLSLLTSYYVWKSY